jgi:vacuolar-type H+-ATPase subunit H
MVDGVLMVAQLQNARTEADKILADAREQAAAIVAAGRQEVAEIKRQLREQLEGLVENG